MINLGRWNWGKRKVYRNKRSLTRYVEIPFSMKTINTLKLHSFQSLWDQRTVLPHDHFVLQSNLSWATLAFSDIVCFTTPFLSNVFIKARNQTRFQRHCVFYVIFENVWVPIKIGSTVHKMNETVWNIVSKMRIPIVAPLQNYVFLFLSCHVHSFSMKRIQNNKISFIVTYYLAKTI